MAENSTQTLGSQFAALSRLTAHRQFGLVLGLAVVVALAAAAIMWAVQPSFVMLLSADAESDFAEAQTVLSRAAIPYEINDRTGALMVPQDQVREARVILGEQGLPSEGTFGFEFLTEGLPLGTSRTIENEAVRRALASEIGRTIAQARNIRSAQVLLALPERSSFIMRDREETKASVYLDLGGNGLDESRIAGITHFVAMSVPGLDAANVAVMDSNGNVLSQGGADGMIGVSTQQRDYTRQLERDFRERIENLLAPAVGEDALRVSVTAEVDFTQTETATESYGSDQPAVLSESISENESSTGTTGGVPGALTNQPPAGGQVATDNAETDDPVAEPSPSNISRSSMRNFQNDRTINYVRAAPASLSRLSIAVVVDDRIVADEAGERTRVARTPEELASLESLVRDAVGFDEARGDQINISNQSFRDVEAPPPPAPEPIWTQPWVFEAARYVAAGLGILLLILFVLRPTLKNLATLPATAGSIPATAGGAELSEAEILQAHRMQEAATPLGRARKFAEEDPRLVAHVVRQWIGTDGE